MYFALSFRDVVPLLDVDDLEIITLSFTVRYDLTIIDTVL